MQVKRSDLSCPSFDTLPLWSDVPEHTTAYVEDSDTLWRVVAGGWVQVHGFTPHQLDQLRQVVREEVQRTTEA